MIMNAKIHMPCTLNEDIKGSKGHSYSCMFDFKAKQCLPALESYLSSGLIKWVDPHLGR